MLYIRLNLLFFVIIIVNSLTYAQSDRRVILHKNNIYCEVIVPHGWTASPNTDPSKNTYFADFYLQKKHDFPLISIFIRELDESSDDELRKIIDKNNETNIKNHFRVNKEYNEEYEIYTAFGYNNYSVCLYKRYEKLCIMIDLITDTIDSKNDLLKTIIEMANNIILRTNEN